MPPLKIINVDSNTPEGIVHFKEWFTKTFPIGTILYLSFYRKENLTEDKILSDIEKRLSKIFNAKNYRKIHDIREDVFVSLFKLEVNIDTASLMIDFWRYFFAVSFFEPINALSFDEFEEYELSNPIFDNEYGNKWLWHKLAERVYIKNIGGQELLISSYAFITE